MLSIALADMKVVPVNFYKEHKAMLGYCKILLEHKGRIAIYDKLITALRTAVDNDGTLDKEATSYNDMFANVFRHLCYSPRVCVIAANVQSQEE